MSNKTDAKPHYHGHRQRLKDKFATHGPDVMADYELLELLLSYAIPRKDVKPLAKDLLNHFTTLSNILGAPLEKLTPINGVGESTAIYLKLLQATVVRYRKEQVRQRPAFQNRLELLDYLHTRLGNLTREEFHVLFLDAKHQILSDDCLFTGTVNASVVYPREVVKAALDKGAVGLVLSHNHPSGQPEPSNADIELTQVLSDAFAPIGISIYDHIIIGDGRHFSFRDKGLI